MKPIVAVGSGTVVAVVPDPNYGGTVAIDHPTPDQLVRAWAEAGAFIGRPPFRPCSTCRFYYPLGGKA